MGDGARTIRVERLQGGGSTSMHVVYRGLVMCKEPNCELGRDRKKVLKNSLHYVVI